MRGDVGRPKGWKTEISVFFRRSIFPSFRSPSSPTLQQHQAANSEKQDRTRLRNKLNVVDINACGGHIGSGEKEGDVVDGEVVRVHALIQVQITIRHSVPAYGVCAAWRPDPGNKVNADCLPGTDGEIISDEWVIAV